MKNEVKNGTVMAISLDGCLRIRSLTSGKSVVELRSHMFPGEWTWCVYRSMKNKDTWDMFENQCAHHDNKDKFLDPVVQPGV